MIFFPFFLIPFFVLAVLALLGFWVWALVDCAKGDFRGNDKIVWILIIIFTNWIGSIIYFAVGRAQKIPPPSGVLR